MHLTTCSRGLHCKVKTLYRYSLLRPSQQTAGKALVFYNLHLADLETTSEGGVASAPHPRTQDAEPLPLDGGGSTSFSLQFQARGLSPEGLGGQGGPEHPKRAAEDPKGREETKGARGASNLPGEPCFKNKSSTK